LPADLCSKPVAVTGSVWCLIFRTDWHNGSNSKWV